MLQLLLEQHNEPGSNPSQFRTLHRHRPLIGCHHRSRSISDAVCKDNDRTHKASLPDALTNHDYHNVYKVRNKEEQISYKVTTSNVCLRVDVMPTPRLIAENLVTSVTN